MNGIKNIWDLLTDVDKKMAAYLDRFNSPPSVIILPFEVKEIFFEAMRKNTYGNFERIKGKHDIIRIFGIDLFFSEKAWEVVVY